MIQTPPTTCPLPYSPPCSAPSPAATSSPSTWPKKHGLEPDPDEAALLPDLLERGTTVFHRTSEDSDEPALMNYHILGFLKEAGKVLNGKAGAGVRNLRYKVSVYVTVTPESSRSSSPPARSWISWSVPCALTRPPARES